MRGATLILAFLFSVPLFAYDELCLSGSQRDLKPANYPDKIRVTNTTVEPPSYQILVDFGSANDLPLYVTNGKSATGQQIRHFCRKMAEELLRARMLVAIESLKLNSQIALLLMLQVGMNSDSSSVCGYLDEALILEKQDTEPSSLWGQELALSVVDKVPFLIEKIYGLVYSSKFCN